MPHAKPVLSDMLHGLEKSMDQKKTKNENYAERRPATIAYFGLKQVGLLESCSPDQTASILKQFEDAISRPISEYGGKMHRVGAGQYYALFGFVRQSVHHALRAVVACQSVLSNLVALREVLAQRSLALPSCHIGIHTAETVILQSLDNGEESWELAGPSLEVARRIQESARSEKTLISEAALQSLLFAMPPDWEIAKSRFEEPGAAYASTDLMLDGIYDLPDEFHSRRILLGPGVKTKPEQAVLDCRYWQEVELRGEARQRVPMLRVSSPHLEFSLQELSLTQPANTAPEQMFGKYRLLEKIGEGGMGLVWLALDCFGNRLAIKQLLPGMGLSTSQLKRFKREAAIMSKLNHRGICRIFEVGEINTTSYIAMEYIEGISLAEMIHSFRVSNSSDGCETFKSKDRNVAALVQNLWEQKKHAGLSDIHELPVRQLSPEEEKSASPHVLPLPQTLALVTQICEALQHAHDHGVLHRDMKPANVMIRTNGEPVIMDFGLAKMEHDETELSLSVSGQMMGTLDYMPPEQACSSKDVTERADVYSLGAILYEMLTGKQHFKSTGNLLQDAQALQAHEPVQPRMLNKWIDADLATITLTALRPLPTERYRSAARFREDVERYRRGDVISARSATPVEVATKWVKRNRAISLLVASFLLLFLASAFGFIQSLRTQVAKAEAARHEAEDARKEAESALREKERSDIDKADAIKRAEISGEAASSAKQQAEQALFEKRKAIQKYAGELEKQENTLRRYEENLKQAKQDLMTLKTALLSVARERMMDFRFRDAEVHVLEALRRDETFSDAWFLRSRLHLARLEFGLAMTAFKTGVICCAKSEPLAKDLKALENILLRFNGGARDKKRCDLSAEEMQELVQALFKTGSMDDWVIAKYFETKTAGEILGGRH